MVDYEEIISTDYIEANEATLTTLRLANGIKMSIPEQMRDGTPVGAYCTVFDELQRLVDRAGEEKAFSCLLCMSKMVYEDLIDVLDNGETIKEIGESVAQFMSVLISLDTVFHVLDGVTIESALLTTLSLTAVDSIAEYVMNLENKVETTPYIELRKDIKKRVMGSLEALACVGILKDFGMVEEDV